MQANISYKFRIYPNTTQREKFSRAFGCNRFVYNHFLAMQIENHKAGGKFISLYDCINKLKALKSEYDFLKLSDSTSYYHTLKHLDLAFKRLFTVENAGFPKFKSKKTNRNTYSSTCEYNSIRIEGNKIRIPKIGLVKIKQHRKIPSSYELKSITIEQVPSGKYFVSLCFRYEKQVFEKEIRNTIGLDYTMNGLYIDSNGKPCGYPMFLKQSLDKISIEQKRLSRMVYGSNNYKKQRVRVARAYEKVSNKRADFLHKKSRELATQYDMVGIEDLSIAAMSSVLNFGKSITDNGWTMFTTMLEYKLNENGGKLVKISKVFPSSQLCNRCGYKNIAVKDLRIREWTCPTCGCTHNRDHNAAINIKKEAERLLAI